MSRIQFILLTKTPESTEYIFATVYFIFPYIMSLFGAIRKKEDAICGYPFSIQARFKEYLRKVREKPEAGLEACIFFPHVQIPVFMAIGSAMSHND